MIYKIVQGTLMNLAVIAALVLTALPLSIGRGEPSHLESELIFPPEHLHNHASCIVECPSRDLLVCWYNGSGERSADDVKVEGARKRQGVESPVCHGGHARFPGHQSLHARRSPIAALALLANDHRQSMAHRLVP